MPAAREELEVPGNMFVPADRLRPLLADLVQHGRPAGPPRPWLGVNLAEQFGRVIVTRVTPDGPASRAGLAPGDIVLAVGEHKVQKMEEFYRYLWAAGDAGVTVRLKLVQRNEVVRLAVRSADRYDHYRKPNTP